MTEGEPFAEGLLSLSCALGFGIGDSGFIGADSFPPLSTGLLEEAGALTEGFASPSCGLGLDGVGVDSVFPGAVSLPELSAGTPETGALTGGFVSVSGARGFGGTRVGADTAGAGEVGLGVDSDLGAAVSSAHAGAAAQHSPTVTSNAVIVDRMSIRSSLLDFNDPAMTTLSYLIYQS